MAPITALTVAQDGANAIVIDKKEARRIRDFVWIPLLASNRDNPLRIDLSCVTFSPEGAMILCRLIAAVVDRIVEVDFSAIKETTKGDHKMLLGLFSASLQGASLQEINVSNNNLGSDGMERLKPLIAKATLRRLCLNDCQLNSQSTAILYHFLQSKTIVTHLDLGSNPLIGEDGGKNIAKLISECISLEHLDLANCNIGFIGSNKIVIGLNAIIEHHSENDQECPLRHINLEGGTFSNEKRVFDKLCGAIGNLHELEYVNISNSQIHASGVEKLERILKRKNKKLEMLFLAQDLVTDAQENVIEDNSQFPPVGPAALHLR